MALHLGVHHGEACGRHGKTSSTEQHCWKGVGGLQQTRRCGLLFHGVFPGCMVGDKLRKMRERQHKGYRITAMSRIEVRP